MFALLAFAFTHVDPSAVVEGYLHAGRLAQGEQALTVALVAQPADDRLRFGLGVIQFVQAVERFGQGLHEYGAKSDATNTLFLRLPVPANDLPSRISHPALCRLFDVLLADLERAERTLAGVTDDQVKLRLRLAGVRLDLTGSGRADAKLTDLFVRVVGRRFDFLADNPAFEVCFDRGDVAWLRGYCHLLSAIIDGGRAFDTADGFASAVRPVFPQVEPDRHPGRGLASGLAVAAGSRLGRCRRHLLAVCELNRETWKHIRAETDDDHEWLPSPKQRSVLRLPVTAERIDDWLTNLQRLEELLAGDRLLDSALLEWVGIPTGGNGGLNVQTLMDDPPAVFDVGPGKPVNPKYLEPQAGRKLFGLTEVVAVIGLFSGDPLGFVYAAYFN